MAKPTAHEVFRARYGDSPNIMTPNVLRRAFRSGFAYELSEGESLRTRRDEPPGQLFGVTVLNLDGTDPEPSRNRCFSSRRAADAYIKAGFPLAWGEA